MSETMAIDTARGAVRPSRNLRANILCGYALFALCSAAVIFGLLGENSEFQKANGFAESNNLAQMHLDGSEQQCMPKSVDSALSGVSPAFLPRGGVLSVGRYRPVTVFGVQLGAASSTAWRLFGCILIGTFAAWMATEVCSGYFTFNGPLALSRLLEVIEDEGRTVGMLQAVGNSLVSVLFPCTLVLVSVVSAHLLYGAYGIGIMTLGFLCSVGCCISISVMGQVANNASHATRANKKYLSLLGSRLTPAGTSFLNSASVLTSITLVFTLLQESNVVPSPRELAPLAGQAPSGFLFAVHGLSLSELSTYLSFSTGAVIPVALCGVMSVSSSVTSDWFLRLFRERERTPDDGYFRLFRKTTFVSIFSSLVPTTVCFMIPVVTGLICGVKGLAALVTSFTGTSYVLSCFVSTLGVRWDSAQRWMGSGRADVREGRADSGFRSSPRLPSEEVSLLRDCISPVMTTCSKSVATAGLLFVQLDLTDASRAWMGYAIGAGWLLACGLLAGIKGSLGRKRLTEAGGKDELGRYDGTKRVLLSVFAGYEEEIAQKRREGRQAAEERARVVEEGARREPPVSGSQDSEEGDRGEERNCPAADYELDEITTR